MTSKKITSQTKFWHCQFVENVEPDKVYPTILNHFHSADNQIRYIKFQIERAPDTGRKHAQGLVAFNAQLRIGKYVPGKRVKTIKSIFQLNSLHIDYANFPNDTIIYVGKKYNRCAIHNKCKCSYQELILENCDVCTQECCSQRVLARWDEENSGPFEFGQYQRNQTNQNNSDQYSEMYIQAAEDLYNGDNIDKVIVDYARITPLGKSPYGLRDISKSIERLKQKKNQRCWKPCNIFVWGDPGTGKSYIGDIIFKNFKRKEKLYKKVPNEKWFNDFNNHEVVVFNEITGSWFKWERFLVLIDSGFFSIEVKNSHANYAPMYHFFTSNNPLKSLYKCDEDFPYIDGIKNKKKYLALERRFDYIIEYRKVNDDKTPCGIECRCCKTKRIFHKGSRDKFNRFEFDIGFDDDVTLEQIDSIIRIKKLSGVIVKKNNKFFWRGKLKVEIDDTVITSCENENDNECDYIYYPNSRFNTLYDIDNNNLSEELFLAYSSNESESENIKKDKGKRRATESISEDGDNVSNSETGVKNNNSKRRRIEQLELETVIQNSINDCSMDVTSVYEIGESSNNNQRIGDELEQLEIEMAIQRSSAEQ